MTRGPATMRNRGFTLLEVVLAIGLAAAVLGLLTTAIDLYLIRVDTSRTQVETAQLARTLLNQISNDLRAARYYAPSDPSSENSDVVDSADASLVQGIFGSATELRVDRSAVWRWEDHARIADTLNADFAAAGTPDHAAMPQTVRYLLGDGKELLADDFAATGVSTEPTASGYAGLYREQASTCAWLAENATTEIVLSSNDTANADLIAPEVVEIEFQYFDGEVLLDQWDSALEQGLPQAIQVRLTMLEEPFEQAASRSPSERDELRRTQSNLVEYRLVVNLANREAVNEAEFPQPVDSPAGTPGPE